MPRSKHTSKRTKKSKNRSYRLLSKKRCKSHTKYSWRKGTGCVKKGRRMSRKMPRKRIKSTRPSYIKTARKSPVARPISVKNRTTYNNPFLGKNLVNTYRWSRNSCFLDSIIVLLLGTMMYSDFIFTKIFIDKPHNKLKVCYDTKEKDDKFILDVKNILLKEALYIYGNTQPQKECSSLRRLFTNCTVGELDAIATGEMEDTDFVLSIIDKIFDLTNIKIRYEYMFKGQTVKIHDHLSGYKISTTGLTEQKQTSIQTIIDEENVLKEFNTRTEDNITYDSFKTYIIDAELITVSVTRINTQSENPIYNTSFNVIPNENILLGSGEIKLKLSGILLWKDFHYTLLIRDANDKWWYYDDTDSTRRNRIELVGSYQNMLNFKKGNPSIWGRDYWYVKV